MKKITLLLLCCSAFLTACDSSNDTANKAANGANGKAVGDFDSEKGIVTSAMDATQDVATDTMADAKELKESSSDVITKTDEVIASVGTDDGKQGESIYKSKCIACHGSGIAGAPKLGDKAAWAPRIAQGDEVLAQHAIKGFKGKTGVMPAKGGFTSLSDEEISLAIQYMVSQSK